MTISVAAALLVTRVIELGLDSSVGPELLLILFISIVPMTGLGVARMLRVTALRREIAELESMDESADRVHVANRRCQVRS